ncbi:hypothetical protein [Burkholderia glumae]|uniref:hypothetical protein n=1 Tax=Burkholderia glumae TaxID=337 RepID=UPI000FDB376B|nr:hypothetical protein [Burkholderia glumae]
MTIKTHPRESTTMPNQQPSAGSLAEIRRTLIPFYQQALYAGLRALELDQKFDVLERIDIRVEGIAEPVHSTIMGAFTQSTSSIAAVYSRLLLEFLGLKTEVVRPHWFQPGNAAQETLVSRCSVIDTAWRCRKLIRLLSRSSQIQTTWRKRGSQRAISRGNDWLTSRPIGG